MDTANKIAKTSMIATLSHSTWQDRKRDPVSEETIAKGAHGKREAFQSYIRLVDLKESVLGDIRRELGTARNFLYARSLPWAYGQRLVPARSVEVVEQAVQEAHADAKRLVEELAKEMEVWLQRGPERLGDRFNKDDYPTPDQLRKSFSFTLRWAPVPTGIGVIAHISQDISDRIARDIRSEADQKMKAFALQTFRRLRSSLEPLMKVVANGGKRVYDVTLPNAIESVEVMRDLNSILENPVFEEMVERFADTLANLSKDSLREQAVLDHLGPALDDLAKQIDDHVKVKLRAGEMSEADIETIVPEADVIAKPETKKDADAIVTKSGETLPSPFDDDPEFLADVEAMLDE